MPVVTSFSVRPAMLGSKPLSEGLASFQATLERIKEHAFPEFMSQLSRIVAQYLHEQLKQEWLSKAGQFHFSGRIFHSIRRIRVPYQWSYIKSIDIVGLIPFRGREALDTSQFRGVQYYAPAIEFGLAPGRITAPRSGMPGKAVSEAGLERLGYWARAKLGVPTYIRVPKRRYRKAELKPLSTKQIGWLLAKGLGRRGMSLQGRRRVLVFSTWARSAAEDLPDIYAATITTHGREILRRLLPEWIKVF